MAFAEVYSALEQKKIDGQENPFAVIASNKLDAVQKYLTETRHIYNPQSFLMSKATWDRLNEDERKIILEAAGSRRSFSAVCLARRRSARCPIFARRWRSTNWPGANWKRSGRN